MCGFPELTSVASLPLGLVSDTHTVTRVHNRGLLHDKTILLQPGDVAPGVGQRNLVNLIGVEPNLALSALEHGSGKALLQLERHLNLGKDELVRPQEMGYSM